MNKPTSVVTKLMLSLYETGIALLHHKRTRIFKSERMPNVLPKNVISQLSDERRPIFLIRCSSWYFQLLVEKRIYFKYVANKCCNLL